MKYSKMIGSVVGALAGIAAAWGLPDLLVGDTMQAAAIVVLSGVATYLFPANA